VVGGRLVVVKIFGGLERVGGCREMLRCKKESMFVKVTHEPRQQ
jgi:hypothetical protein